MTETTETEERNIAQLATLAGLGRAHTFSNDELELLLKFGAEHGARLHEFNAALEEWERRRAR